MTACISCRRSAIRSLSPFGELITRTRRPVVQLSLALNYAFGGLRVWGYHAVNLTIHLLAGLTLFGIIRRTLSSPRLAKAHGRAAPWLAFAVALLWVVHPPQHPERYLHHPARASPSWACFYLLTLYCLIRGRCIGKPPRQGHMVRGGGFWLAACPWAARLWLSTIPVVVLLYDRTFLSKSFCASDRPALGVVPWFGRHLDRAGALRGSWRRAEPVTRRPALRWASATRTFKPWWYAIQSARRDSALPAAVLLASSALSWITTGRWSRTASAFVPQSFSRSWPCWAVRRGVWSADHGGAFAGAWFFLILAPTSSFHPDQGPGF